MKKVLIVEDDLMLRNVYELIVKREGYIVDVAGDGKEGLEKLASFKPDIVLLDMLMPVKTGLQLLEDADIKKNYPKTSVIILSNLSDSETISSALKLGASEHLIKSNVLPHQVTETIKKYS